MLAFLGSKLGEWVAGLLAILAAVGSIFAIGRSSGKTSVQAADQSKTIKTAETAHDVQDDVAAKPDPVVSDELHQWNRD